MARKPQAMAAKVSACVRSSFQAVPYIIDGTATPRTRRVSPICMARIIAGSRAVGNHLECRLRRRSQLSALRRGKLGPISGSCDRFPTLGNWRSVLGELPRNGPGVNAAQPPSAGKMSDIPLRGENVAPPSLFLVVTHARFCHFGAVDACPVERRGPRTREPPARRAGREQADWLAARHS